VADNNSLALATRSGIVLAQDLPGQVFAYYGAPTGAMTVGPDGNLWLTTGTSSIVRVSGLDTILGGLDDRHRPKRAPDFAYDQYDSGNNWTNVTGTARSTFAGVAKPGAEVTL
jgi:streptogramin lyase